MITTFATILLAISSLATHSLADTFGSGTNQFDIEFVSIGNPGNTADTTGKPNPAGAVDYTYRIGKFEISEDMINKANTLGGVGITHDNRGANKPATDISWFEAAMFVNWLNDEKGASRAYKFNGSTFELWQAGDAGYDPNNLFRNSQAFYFLPSDDEWYKAAYYDPNADVYYDYPTRSNTAPTAVASGTAADTAVYGQVFTQSPADITLAGGLSPYGTMGQGGNVWEWEETEFDLVNNSTSSGRGLRGGGYTNIISNLRSSSREFDALPTIQPGDVGFRVASIALPELAGDFNDDGVVGNADLTLLLNFWGDAMPPVPPGWTGSLPTPDAIGNDELTALLNTWGDTAASDGARLRAAAVPEPTSAVLLTLTSVGALIYRNRARRRVSQLVHTWDLPTTDRF